jgi:hypothetical protein
MTTSLQTASTALVVSPSAVAPGASVTFTATVTGVAGAAVPTGTVSFNNGGAVLGTGVVNGLGVATLTTKTLGAGSYSVVAVYSGDSLYSTNSSTAQPLTVTVPAAAPTVTLAAAPVAITLGKTSTLTWSSTNATACTASNGWSGSEAINGTAVETPAAVGLRELRALLYRSWRYGKRHRRCDGECGSGGAQGDFDGSANRDNARSNEHADMVVQQRDGLHGKQRVEWRGVDQWNRRADAGSRRYRELRTLLHRCRRFGQRDGQRHGECGSDGGEYGNPRRGRCPRLVEPWRLVRILRGRSGASAFSMIR